MRTTTSWDLSADNPLAVVIDAPAASLAKAQGLVAELVQEAPPALPLLLASPNGLAAGPGVNRDALMAALAKQRPGTATSVADGIGTAAGAGVQHVLVVSTCAAPPPARPRSAWCRRAGHRSVLHADVGDSSRPTASGP